MKLWIPAIVLMVISWIGWYRLGKQSADRWYAAHPVIEYKPSPIIHTVASFSQQTKKAAESCAMYDAVDLKELKDHYPNVSLVTKDGYLVLCYVVKEFR